jgi:hypothetical protein
MSIQANNQTLTADQYLNQFNKGGGKTSGNTAPKKDVSETNIVQIVRDMPEEFKIAELSYLVWKENNYTDIEGDSKDYLTNSWFGKKHYDSVIGATETKTPFTHPQQVRTALEYKVQNIEMNLKELEFGDVEELLSVDGANEKRTKADLLEIIHKLQNKLWTVEKQATFEVMLENEEKAAAKWKVLLDAGFTDVVQAKDSIFANIEAAKAPTGIPVLIANGYTLTDNNFDPATMKLKVVFKEAATPEEQKATI